jgi:hypothetical protein
VLAISAPLGIFLAWFKSAALYVIDSTTFLGSLLVCMVIGVIFGSLMLGAGYGLKIKEITDLGSRLADKIKIYKS